MSRRRAARVSAAAVFTVAAGCASGNSAPTGSLDLTSGGGGSPGMSTTIYSQYGMTVFGGAGDCQSMACGISNSCSSQPWYSASSQRYGCGVHLQVTAPNGKCVVVQTEDAGPASWVESDAGTPILDSGPQVAQYLFGTDSLGWSDIKDNPGKYIVQVSTTSAALGPCSGDGGTTDSGGGGGASGSGGGSDGSGGGGGSGSGGGGASGSGGGGAGGSSGSGGGGSSGSGGSGGKGGSGGSGGSGSSGSDAGAYAFFEPRNVDRHHSVELMAGGSRSIPFTWQNAAGLAPPADLWVEVAGRPFLQVSSVDGHPFARAGLDVVALEAGTPYRILLEGHGDLVSASIVRQAGAVVLRSEVRGSGTGATGVATADVVLPGALWRASIVSDRL